MRQVFISYSHLDVDAAKALEDLLTKKGFAVWRDTTRMAPGVDFRGQISRALRDSFAVVTILSANSVGSDWVRHETSYANTVEKCVAFSLGALDPRAIPDPLQSIHFADFATRRTQWAGDQGSRSPRNPVPASAPTSTIRPRRPS